MTDQDEYFNYWGNVLYEREADRALRGQDMTVHAYTGEPAYRPYKLNELV